jgi:hypothetical protein
VRAVVDWALAGGAAAVKIVEGGRHGANFAACGYDIFDAYDPRVQLLDLSTEPATLAIAPPGSPPPGTAGAPAAFHGLYLPSVLLQPDVMLVSVAKLKTHAETMATLAIKNLFGLPARPPYFDPLGVNRLPLFLLHDRGLGQSISDVARARPIDFAVVEGVWGLQGNGPTDLNGGTRVQANVILAGRNPLAVDLASLETIGVPPDSVQHLQYAYLNGLGPADMSEVDLVGDAVNVPPFAHPNVQPPKVWYPRVTPTTFSPSQGGTTTIVYRLAENARVQVQVLRTSDPVPEQTVIRALRPWSDGSAGTYALQWGGRDDAGQIVPPSYYGVRVQVQRASGGPIVAGINWVGVT